MRKSRHLTQRGSSWVFQLRPPKSLDPSFRLSPIRVSLGAIPGREARRLATILAGAAFTAFGRLRHMENSPQNPVAYIQHHLHVLLPTLRGLDAAASNNASDPLVAQHMVDVGLDGLIALGNDRKHGGALARMDGAALEQHYLRVTSDEAYARVHFGVEAPAPSVPVSALDVLKKDVDAIVVGLGKKIDGLTEQLQPKLGPLFSEAADSLIETVKKARGVDHDEVDYLEHRKAVFILLVGDKKVGLYCEKDLQTFVDEIKFLNDDYYREKGYHVSKIPAYIERNKSKDIPGLARSTIENNYLPRITNIISHGCKQAHIPYPIENLKIIYSDRIPSARQQVAPDPRRLNIICRKGVATRVLSDVITPPMAAIVGRRIGIMTYMRRENIIEYAGHYIVAPTALVESGGLLVVPFKTSASLQPYVLHDFFVEIGFTPWMLRQTGFIFKWLHMSDDPAGTMQKRMDHLLDGETDPGLKQSIQAFRHLRVATDRDTKVDPERSRQQAGHEPGDVHGRYGAAVLSPQFVHDVATAPLPAGIDKSIYDGLDFDELAANRRWPRDFKKKWAVIKKALEEAREKDGSNSAE